MLTLRYNIKFCSIQNEKTRIFLEYYEHFYQIKINIFIFSRNFHTLRRNYPVQEILVLITTYCQLCRDDIADRLMNVILRENCICYGKRPSSFSLDR